MMRRLFSYVIGAVSILAADAALGAPGVKCTWLTSTTGGTTPQTALEWTDETMWQDGLVPNQGVRAAEILPSSLRYFRLPDEITFGALHCSSAKAALIGGLLHTGDGLYDNSTVTAGGEGLNSGRFRYGTYVYANVEAAGREITGTWYIAGDINCGRSDSGIMASIGSQYWQGNWYANSADEDRGTVVHVTGPVVESNGTIFFYGPRGCNAHSGTWSQTAGSVFVTYSNISQVGGFVSPGGRVTGTGIPDGTFVRRWYESAKVIELSKPVTETAAANAVSFLAYSPKACVQMDMNWTISRDSDQSLTFKKYRAQDTFVCDVATLVSPSTHTVNVNCGATPGKIRPKKTSDFAGDTTFNGVDIDFMAPPKGKTAGFAYIVNGVFNSQVNAFTVSNGVSAVIANISSALSAATVAKSGPGSLTLALKPALTDFASTNRVDEGELRFSSAAAGPVTIGPLLLAAGTTASFTNTATYRLSNLTAAGSATLNVEAGATLDLAKIGALPAGVSVTGAGRVVFATIADYTAATVAPTCVIVLASETTARSLRPLEAITPEVVGTPAFWVQADKNVSTFTSNGMTCVSRWLDCRATSDSEAFRDWYATNDCSQIAHAHGYAPSRWTWALSRRCVNHAGNTAFATDATGSGNARFVMSGMVWNKPITNVWAVFTVVYEDGGSGQAVLGRTCRFPDEMGSTGYGDFCRGLGSFHGDAAGIASPSKIGILSTKASSDVKNGWIYFDGKPITWDTIVCNSPNSEILEMHPKGTAGKADAFAMQQLPAVSEDDGYTDSGCCYQFETIVYTNQLTQTQRAQIYDYLARKYKGVAYNPAYAGEGGRVIGGAPAEKVELTDDLNLSVSDTLGVGTLSGTGTFVKTGAGTLYADLVDGASLDVREGAVDIYSVQPPVTGYAGLATNHFVHFDAANTNNMTSADHIATINDGYDEDGNSAPGYTFKICTTNMVDHWYDARFGNDGKHIYGTSRKSDGRYPAGWLVTNQVNGLPAVDYGKLFYHHGDMVPNRRFFHEFHLTDENVTQKGHVKSVFVVKETSRGGNAVLGAQSGGTSIPRADAALGDYTQPITSSKSFTARLNGVDVDPSVSGHSGGWDVLSMHTTGDFTSDLVGGNNNFIYTGGQKVGELIVYTNLLGFADSRLIQGYLSQKWLSRKEECGSPSSAGDVKVASGAKVVVSGGAPLTAKSLSGAGTIEGSVKLAAGAEIEVVVNENGTVAVSSPTVTGALDLSAGGTVRVTGRLEKIRSGTYPILSAASVAGGNWTLVAGSARCVLRLKTGPTSLDLVATSPGHLFFVK